MPALRRPMRLDAAIAAIALTVWLALRVVLWLKVGPAEAGWVQVARIFGLGLWFDLATLCFVLAPLLLARALRPRKARAPPRRIARWIVLGLAVFALLFGAVAEVVFWNEFGARFNFIAIDYLLYTHEVVGNIVSSYPVASMMGAIALAAALVVLALRRRFTLETAAPTMRGRCGAAALAFALPALSYVAADADQMRAGANAYANELSGNGLFTLAAAARRNELDYERNYLTMAQPKADRILARLGVRRQPLSHVSAASLPAAAERTPRVLARRPRNVVLITVESLSAEFLGAYGNAQGLTPNLDALARDGVRFERVFASGTRTVRGLEALSLGTPPVPGQAIVRRPHNEHLATLGGVLQRQGYATYFVYGGYGYFDNMNAYFRNNGYRVIDRTDFAAASIPAENIWGVADEALFANALDALDGAHASGKPFLALIMTTSNHRPFTYPDGRIDIPSPGGREGAVKYSDYAIGEFVRQAAARPWFDETLFVVVADHCAAVAGNTKLPLAKYRIPLILYAPKLLHPDVYSNVGSQIDVPPTIVHLLGLQGAERFFGQSLLGTPAPRAFVSNYQELGYYKGDLLTVLSPKRHAEAFRIDPLTYAATPAPLDQSLLEEAIAYYQTGSRAFRDGALKLD